LAVQAQKGIIEHKGLSDVNTGVVGGNRLAKVSRIVKIVARAGKRPELLQLLERRIEHAHVEPGTEVYVFHEEIGDDVTIWAWEMFSSNDSLELHRSSSAVVQIRPEVEALTDAPPEIVTLRPYGGKGIETT
jgi:quinol monooxygenase YgiN